MKTLTWQKPGQQNVAQELIKIIINYVAELRLIYLAGKKASLDEVEKWNIPPQVLDEFGDYTRLYEANGGNGAPLQAKYGKTYWFYFHYATMKKGK